ncbi:SIR2 family protein [Methanoculleus sp. 10]|uniref:SIR2 family protein n=1 Tax=Methanoculleus sp. 10 TaxID=430615 RepID=UPI001B539708|nr:SIR2 family protein [Methanoculleus sp. 10]MBP7299165.1 SIR2 family protein [Methanoculleus sp.]
MNIDAVVPVAYAMHASPKRYALLLGAGISVAAGLPTASDASGNMILAIAGGRGKKVERGENNKVCLAWFEEAFGEPATFQRLMQELGISEENRKDGLKRFIYKTDENGDPVPGIPTEAHRAIARLVKSGVISLIITTNFDTLMEEALRAEAVPYEVITEESDGRQMSVFPDRCRVLKVNGDFERGTLRITPEDLKHYPPAMEDYLRRIFGEYGLVTCGWSGSYDTHLVEILCAADIPRRYPVFCCRRNGGSVPPEICEALLPNGIDIDDADEFFTTLEAVIERFARFEPRTTLTVAAAVGKVRDALRDPRPDLLLSDLINTETDRIYQELASGSYRPDDDSEIVAQDYFKEVLDRLEHLTAPLASMTAMIAYYDNGVNTDLIVDAVGRLINIPSDPTRNLNTRSELGPKLYDALYRLRCYPALLVIYASGIAAVKKGHLGTLEAILTQPKIVSYINSSIKWMPYHDDVNTWSVIAQCPDWVLDCNYERYQQKVNVHYLLYRVVQSILQPVIPNELAYDGMFDTFEYLYGLSYLRLGPSPRDGISVANPPFPLLSRVWVKTVGFDRRFEGMGKYTFPEQVVSYLQNIQKKAEGSDFFDGDLQEFERQNRAFAKFFGIDAPDTRISLPRTY